MQQGLAKRAAALAAVLFLAVAPFTGPAATQQNTAMPSASAVTITGVDSHDGQIYEDGGVFYWVGTRYGCGFYWTNPATPWCGFGVWTAPAVDGPWTYVRDLFDPAGTSAPAYHSETWQQICRGDGCFNPRMTKRPDGVWVLWFNAPRDLRVWGGNQFWAMGCNSATGPCGAAAGPPYGTTAKPPLWICNTGGDFSILDDAGTWYLVCGTSTWTISIERLQWWGTTGTAVGAANLAGLKGAEGVGAFKTPNGNFVITFGANCPYCSGTDTSYAVSAGPMGPYVTPAGATPRRAISAHSCGGQPRTVTVIAGQAYQQIDHWYAGHNQTNAATTLFPLIESGPLLAGAAGERWAGGFATFNCGGQ